MARRRRRATVKRQSRPSRRGAKNGNPQLAVFVLVAVILGLFVFMTTPRKQPAKVLSKLPEKPAETVLRIVAVQPQPVEPAAPKPAVLPAPLPKPQVVLAPAKLQVSSMPAKPEVAKVVIPTVKPQVLAPVKPQVMPKPVKPQVLAPVKPQVMPKPVKQQVMLKPVKPQTAPKPAKPAAPKALAKKTLMQRLFAPKPPAPKPVKVKAAVLPAPRPSVSKPAVVAPAVLPQPAAQPAASSGIVKAKIAIVIDDWGYNLDAADMLDPKYPVTCAVLPNLAASRQVSEKLHSKGQEIILHLPMEPREKLNLENDTILISMNDAQIRKILDKDLESVLYARGINNHMGSFATSDAKVMKAVFKEMKKKRLYFLDSSTAAGSVCPKLAPKFGINFAKRNVFIDNESDPEYIKKQILGLALVARTYGSAIGIGHARPNTLETLKEIMPELESQGYKFVFVSELAG